MLYWNQIQCSHFNQIKTHTEIWENVKPAQNNSNARYEHIVIFLIWELMLVPIHKKTNTVYAGIYDVINIHLLYVFTWNNHSICKHLLDTNHNHLKGNAVLPKWRYRMCFTRGLHPDVYSGIRDNFTIVCNHFSHCLRRMNTVIDHCFGWWGNHIILQEKYDVYL